jgi:hypothetical protein
MLQTLDFNSPSMWDQKRPSSKDIQAAITAVETAPDVEEVREVVDLSRSWKHTPAFEMAMRTSNASWDRRATSMDIMAKIRAVEMLEAKEEEEEEEVHQDVATNIEEISTTPRIGTCAPSGMRQRQLHQETKVAQDVLEIINERQGGGDITTSLTSFDIKRKASKGGGSEDDEISELSEPTFSENNPFNKGRGIPQALNVLQSTDDFVDMSPMVSSVLLSPSGGFRKKLLVADNVTTLPAFPPDAYVVDKTEAVVSINMHEETADDTIIEETEEQKQRREKAEARVKKMEAITARRSAGIVDEDETSMSGISKRHRLRRKKKMQLPQCQEEVSIKSDDRSVHPSDDRSTVTPTPVKIDTEEEKQRKIRAEARAKKLEEMSSMRNSGYVNDDESAITGISKRHRIRRKKSALAAITPEERERAEWKNSVYASVMNAEQVQWRTSIYAHVIHAETTRTKNITAKLELEEKTLAEHRRLENKKRLDKMARKFASRAEQFHKIRQEGREDDDTSVVSGASRLKRRRTRKSIVPPHQEAPLPEESLSSTIGSLEVRLQQIKERSNDAPCVVNEQVAIDEVPSEPIVLTVEDIMEDKPIIVQEAMEQEIQAEEGDKTVKKKRNRKKKKPTKTND